MYSSAILAKRSQSFWLFKIVITAAVGLAVFFLLNIFCQSIYAIDKQEDIGGVLDKINGHAYFTDRIQYNEDEKIEHVYLDDVKLDVDEFKTLMNIESLTSLSIRNLPINGDVASAINEAAILRLNINGCELDREAVDILSKNSTLNHLTVGNSNFPIENIGMLDQDVFYSVSYEGNLKVSDNDIRLLINMKNIRYLNLRNTKVSGDKIISLHRKRPDLFISWTDVDLEG